MTRNYGEFVDTIGAIEACDLGPVEEYEANLIASFDWYISRLLTENGQSLRSVGLTRTADALGID